MSKIIIVAIFLLLSGCARDWATRCINTSEVCKIEKINEDNIDYKNKSDVNLWQTYYATQGGMHFWNETDVKYEIFKMQKIVPDVRGLYAYVQGGALVFEFSPPLNSGFKFRLENNELVPVLSRFVIGQKSSYVDSGYVYTSNKVEGAINACSIDGNLCKSIAVQPGSTPLVYASANGSTLVVNNWGDAWRFNGSEWCRMVSDRKKLESYSCDFASIDSDSSPTGKQFYSSINYQGKTLVGHYPSGFLYEFDGVLLKPSELTPPQIVNGNNNYFEAQSMANYCGDLFVGYYPRGEIFRYDHSRMKWEMFFRPFEDSFEMNGVPYYNMYTDSDNKKSKFFYAQRITSLVPYEDSLYATTSNLNEWGIKPDPPYMTPNEISNYGAVFRIRKPQCVTKYN